MNSINENKVRALSMYNFFVTRMYIKNEEEKGSVPQFFIYMCDDYSLKYEYFKEIVKDTNFFDNVKGNRYLFKSKLFNNSYMYFCNEKSFNKSIFDDNIKDIYCFTTVKENNKKNYKNYFNILNDIHKRHLYFVDKE